MKPKFSLVIPVFNEDESLPELLEKIQLFFKKFKHSFEVIFIDDGSTDNSLNLLKQFSKENNNIKVFSFRRNLGKSPALMMGFSKAQGDYVMMLDADLQDDPENIKVMFEYMQKNNLDLVTGWRRDRKDSTYKRITSKFFNKLVSLLFGANLHDLNSGLKLYKLDLAKELEIYGGMHRFIPIIAKEMGYKVGEAPTTHNPRKYGKSKYKSSKVFTDIPDLITIYFLTKYNRRPLHFFGKIGGIIFISGSVILLYLTVLRFQGESIGTRPLLLLGALLVIAGIQTIFTGLIADLIVNLTRKDQQQFPLRHDSTK